MLAGSAVLLAKLRSEGHAVKICARVRAEAAKAVVGQDATIDLLAAARSCGGHVLLEGVPGVAKTLLARRVSRGRSASSSAACSSRPTCCPRTSRAR